MDDARAARQAPSTGVTRLTNLARGVRLRAVVARTSSGRCPESNRLSHWAPPALRTYIRLAGHDPANTSSRSRRVRRTLCLLCCSNHTRRLARSTAALTAVAGSPVISGPAINSSASAISLGVSLLPPSPPPPFSLYQLACAVNASQPSSSSSTRRQKHERETAVLQHCNKTSPARTLERKPQHRLQ